MTAQDPAGPNQVTYRTNALGDVYARVVDGQEERVNLDDWGWGTGEPENRRTLEEVQGLPYFTVTVTDGQHPPWA